MSKPTKREGGARDRGVAGNRPSYMSYSRMDSILTCGHKFYLERVRKVPSRDHWASVGGSAFHSVVEQILTSESSSQEGMKA